MTSTTASTVGIGRLVLWLAGFALMLAACGSDDAEASTAATSRPQSATTEATTTQAPTTEATTSTVTSESTTSTSDSSPTSDEGQDTAVINDWRLDVQSLPCEPSDLPGSPGGEAVLPASWAAGNADFVNFIVDGDQRPANSVRDVTGPGNIQVPCDPALNDGHEVMIIAYTGNPGDPGPGTTGQTLIVVTTATTDGDEGAVGLAGDWVLTTMGPADDPVAVSTARLTTLSFSDGELRGDAPCNRYRAPYTLAGSRLVVESVAATKALCGDPDLDRQEADYLLALDRTTGASFDGGDTLVISYDGANELRYRRA